MSEEPTACPLARVRRLAWWIDSSIRLPGGYRIGFDGLIGLIPGIGDLTAGAMSSYIIVEAVRMRVPVNVLIPMGLNVLLEAVVGVIPVFGDLFDFAFKANERNVRLIEGYLGERSENAVKEREFLGQKVSTLAGRDGAWGSVF
jgi:hypothetical protein